MDARSKKRPGAYVTEGMLTHLRQRIRGSKEDILPSTTLIAVYSCWMKRLRGPSPRKIRGGFSAEPSPAMRSDVWRYRTPWQGRACSATCLFENRMVGGSLCLHGFRPDAFFVLCGGFFADD